MSITLYGTPLSLYTGKVRSYLIKNGLPYRELTPTTRHYAEYVLPEAKMRMLPTVETAEGDVIRDSTAILDHFEALAGHPASPTTPRQRIVSRLFDVIGMEGLLRPAMHYRWNFPENEAFLAHHFATLIPPGRDAAQGAAKNMDRMRQATVAFGATPERFELIERLYRRWIAAFDRHFARWPYLLGNRPCIGDFGLISPMYGHLGRDPKPLSILQSEAIHLFRWVERMNRPEPDAGEFATAGDAARDEAFAPDDEIPDTLVAVLREVAVDFVPETLAAAATINYWLAGEERPAGGTPLLRGVGMTSFEISGATLHALAQPLRFYLLGRVQADFDAMEPREQASVESLLKDCGLLPILSARLDRQIDRSGNLEVWRGE